MKMKFQLLLFCMILILTSFVFVGCTGGAEPDPNVVTANDTIMPDRETIYQLNSPIASNGQYTITVGTNLTGIDGIIFLDGPDIGTANVFIVPALFLPGTQYTSTNPEAFAFTHCAWDRIWP